MELAMITAEASARTLHDLGNTLPVELQSVLNSLSDTGLEFMEELLCYN